MKPFSKLRDLLKEIPPGEWMVDDEIYQIVEAYNALPRVLKALDVAVEALNANITLSALLNKVDERAIHIQEALAKIKALAGE